MAAARAKGGHGVRQRRPGVWEIRFSLGVDPVNVRPDGSLIYRQKSVQFEGTKTAARAERQRLMDEAAQASAPRAGYAFRRLLDKWLEQAETFDLSERRTLVDEVAARLLPDVDHSFGDLFEQWIATAELEASTVQAHRMLYNRHIEPVFASVKLRNLTTQEIEDLYGKLRRAKPHGAGLHPRSIRRIHAIVNSALKRAVAWEWLDRNPAEFAKAPRIHGRPDTYTPTLLELQRALAAAIEVGPWAGAFVWTAAATGLRRGELCGLQWGDVDGQTLALHVRRNVVDVAGRAVEKLPKTGKARRVEIPAELVAVLAAYEETQPAGSTWLWTVDGERVKPERLTDTWNTVRARAGIPKACRLHDLRHAYGTIAVEHGGESVVAAVADQLGHGDMTTTMRNYLTSVTTGRRKVADLMGRQLAGTVDATVNDG